MARPQTGKSVGASTPDSVADREGVTPSHMHGGEHSFTIQMIFELQKSMGQLLAKVDALNTNSEKQQDKLDKIEEKLSTVTHKIYAAGVVLAILVVVGGFFVNKAWDMMMLSIKTIP
ncbi:hypothetical protein J2X32_003157 [Rheinheimera pacifica]|uniref:hypothetical protein n=1 Tax=Rheinheimera pacifica TaxID=173990 RepID=UPI00285D490D|nr:hypothetical protein [Rheinheimera pacifica]MDR6984513.1 hypothetical protein [Rheinheimera pacifica]